MIQQPDEYWMIHIWYLSIQKSVRNKWHRFTVTSILKQLSFTERDEQVNFPAPYKYFVQNFLETCKLRLLQQCDFKGKSKNHRL